MAFAFFKSEMSYYRRQQSTAVLHTGTMAHVIRQSQQRLSRESAAPRQILPLPTLYLMIFDADFFFFFFLVLLFSFAAFLLPIFFFR